MADVNVGSRTNDLRQSAAIAAPVAIVISGTTLKGSGGAERRFIRLWAYLVERGVACVLITNRSLFASAVEAGLATAHPDPRNAIVVPDSGRLRRGIAMYMAIRRSGCRIVHLPLVQTQLVFLYFLLQITPALRVVHTVTAVYFAHDVAVPKIQNALSHWLWRFSVRIDSLYEGFIDLYARPLRMLHKVTVSPCSFTDIGKYSKKEPKDGTIVFAGSLTEEKNPVMFLNALAMLRRDGVPFKALIAGKGPMANTIREKVAIAKLSDNVEIRAIPDMSEVFVRSSIFVSIQKTENYPSQSLLEAMVARNAVVATNVGETHKLVRDGETGVLIAPDASELAAALMRLLSNESERFHFGEAARALVVQEHRIERFAEYMIGVWASAAQ